MRDTHMHCNFGDGKNSIAEMASAAQKAGFREIAFTEHFNNMFAEINKRTGKKCHIYPEEVEEYYRQCRNAERQTGIKIIRGFELSYLEKDEQELKDFVQKNRPQTILLAVHHLDLIEDWKREDGRLDKAGYSVFLKTGKEELQRQYGGFRNVAQAYFERLEKALNAGFENVCPSISLAHINPFGKISAANRRDFAPYLGEIARITAKKGYSLEINFHYYQEERVSRPDFNCAQEFLDYGGSKDKIIFASDAHSTSAVSQARKNYAKFQCKMAELRLRK